MKNFISTLLIFSVLFFPIQVTATNNKYLGSNGVSVQKISNFIVNGNITINGVSKRLIKISVTTPQNNTIWYDVDNSGDNFTKTIWLTDGIGNYKVSVLANKEDKLYDIVTIFSFKNAKNLDKTLFPEKYIESNHEDIISLSREITRDLNNDLDKTIALYLWVIDNMEYDKKKYKHILNKDYSDKYGALVALKSKKGVCFDYATLYAALGRSIGLKVKVIKGNYKYSNGKTEYHAWNEVYISAIDKWIKLDTTFSDSLNKHYIYFEDRFKNHFPS